MSARLSVTLSTLRLTRRASLGALVWAVLGDRVARGEEGTPFRVIVHPDNPARTIDRGALAKMFLKEASKWDDGEAAHPVDLRADSETRSRFSEAIIKRSVSAVRSYWQQKIFSGRGVPPPEVETDAEVVHYVLRYRGSVGYVSSRADVLKAKVLTVNY
jgi:ABC-type phosphate transport system substrate-binding protein